ncbi:hypothetical protein D3C85_1263960 [compost metagenome]
MDFNFEQETADFQKLFSFLSDAIGDGAFVKYRGNNPIGALAPAYYEAVTVGVWRALANGLDLRGDLVRQCIIDTVQTEAFRNNTGPGANSKEKLEGRINSINSAIEVAHRV